MPRKKKTVLNKVSPLHSQVSREISTKLNALPPLVYGMIAQTPDQRAMWFYSKQFFKRVGDVIDAHSNGGVLPTFGDLPKDEREDIHNRAWLFISFYNMAFFNWESIAPHLEGWGAVEIPKAVSAMPGQATQIEATLPTTDLADLDTPLDLLLEVMKCRAFAMMHNAFSMERTEGVPYRVRAHIADMEKARRADASPETVTKGEAKIRAQFEKEPWAILEHHCSAAVVKSRPKAHTAQKQSLDAYLKAARAEEALWKTRMHKRRKPQRVAWQEGYQVS